MQTLCCTIVVLVVLCALVILAVLLWMRRNCGVVYRHSIRELDGHARDHCISNTIRELNEWADSPAGRHAREKMFLDPDETENPYA